MGEETCKKENFITKTKNDHLTGREALKKEKKKKKI